MATVSDRLPGVHFETVRPPAAPALPRMDIAAFAGFAAAGPVGLPLAVEDVVRFGDVFGAELPLAWDAAAGAAAYAHLPSAVREFFRNGGRRCHVVRLAENAETAAFRLPGLLRARAGAVTGAAWARASSPGSWSDDVRVNATVLRTGIPASAYVIERTGTAPGVRLLRPLERGLLRLEVRDVVGFLAAPPADTAADRPRAQRDAELLRPAAQSYWFREALPRKLPKRRAAVLHLLAGEHTRTLTLQRWSTGDIARFQVPVGEVEDVQPGCWLQLDLPVHPNSRFRREVFLIVDDVTRGARRAVLTVRRGWRALVRDRAWNWAARRSPRLSLVAAELWASRTAAATARVADVALTPAHPRWYGRFPDDATLYADAEALVQRTADGLWLELSRPRFPLAAPRFADEELLLPLGLEAMPVPEHTQPALTSGRERLERDGLAELNLDLFFDRDLRRSRTETLLADAFDLEYGRRAARRPTGVHALIGVEEASLLALPDAVHRGFVRSEGAARMPPRTAAAPTLLTVRARGHHVVADWTNVSGATGYVLEHSPDARFRSAARTLRTTLSLAQIPLAQPCPEPLFVRVRAQTAAGSTPWSNTLSLAPPADAFDVCGRVPLRAPALRVRLRRGRLVLTWQNVGERYRLERSAEPTFHAPELVYEGPLRRAELWLPAQTAYFRVAAARSGEESPWSGTRRYTPPLPFRWQVAPPSPESQARLLEIHTVLLRMCAARADVFAVLSLPADYREEAALQHAAALGARLGAGSAESGDAGGRVLSFGALYHPWTFVPGERADGGVRAVPPDGAICGVMAARALEAGAWAVPANRALAGVVALEPQLPERARAAFFGRRVNLIAPYPEGFLVWSEETLSDQTEYTGIGVRRLLILLRRLALREGTLYVFQPHGGAFRRLVQRQFDQLLDDLFRRGAFAGRQAEEGFRVVTDDSVNPATSVEQGRLVVELRVAPSRPLHFLTVRLVQTGAGLSVGEL